MTHWMMAFMTGLLLLTVVPPRNTNVAMQSAQSAEMQAQAVATVRYINLINDKLYDHPQEDGSVTVTAPDFPMGPVHNIREQGRTWVYQTDHPGLMNALITASLSSYLLGRVHNRQLLDGTGKTTGLTVPNAIPNEAIVYLN